MRKHVLITGGSRGIGKAIALRFASQEFNVTITYAHNEKAAEETLNEVESKSVEALALKIDLKRIDKTLEIIQNAIQKFGPIDVLINNAGVKRDCPIDLMSEEDYDLVMDTNVKGSWAMIKHTINENPKHHPLRIINITSGTGIVGRENQVNYAMSKFALNGMVKALGKELGPKGITINAVSPGLTDTDMTSYVSPEDKKKYADTIPLKRLGTTQDIANACLFLASDEAGFINGQVIPVNGGIHGA